MNKTKNTLKIIFLLVGMLTITFSCQKDDIQLEQESEFISKADFPFELKTKTYKQLSQNAKFTEALNLITKKSKGQSYNRSKTVMEDQYGFTIDSTRINEVSSENYTSYTFLIHRDTLTESYFENLVVEIDSTNDISAVIVKYTLNSDMVFNANHNSYTIDAEIEVTNINYDNSYAKLSSDCVGILTCPWGVIGDHVATQKCIDEGRGDLYLDTSMCGEGNGGSGSNPDTSNAGNPGNTGDGTDETCNTCTGGQNTTDPSNTGDNTDPVVTSTVTDSPEYLRKKDFIRTKLSSEQKDWFNSQPQETQDLIINYLESAYQNGDSASSEYPEEAQEFAVLAVDALEDGSEVDFDDNIIYESTFLQFPCQKIIIEEAIGVCSPLTELVLDIFEANDNSNLILKVVSNLGSNADTDAVSVYNPITHTCNTTIQFNQTYIENATDLSIARTAVHESLHAILAYMAEDGLLVNSNNQPLEGFEQLVQAYIDYQSGLPQYFGIAHHELMADFVENMATSLSTYSNQNGYNNSFNFYKKLCWAGLTTTDAFLTLYPKYLDPNDEVNNPTNYNPEWLDIKLTIQAEIYNQTQTFTHPNGNIYEFIPKGIPANTQEPCSN